MLKLLIALNEGFWRALMWCAPLIYAAGGLSALFVVLSAIDTIAHAHWEIPGGFL